MENLIDDIKHSYYEYVSKIAPGCEAIANQLRLGEINDALHLIINFAEGLSWLLSVEEKMKEYELKINSRIGEAQSFLKEINHELEQGDYITVADLFEYEIYPLFSSSTEWVFEKVN
ncbi:hypothetical protein [Lysinibacillus endophyticus]|uniref:hypothetical protein n=1 Tax=Ureibacillus endophyticus TaxID=1978490 RepID=UPI0020A1F866|nr:hypothetical protein [Lysinibacillus endophyticus]MCP1143740.1 hypothetical protein [Lysinibacillus endophyticus]